MINSFKNNPTATHRDVFSVKTQLTKHVQTRKIFTFPEHTTIANKLLSS